jgi:hypothetical protein
VFQLHKINLNVLLSLSNPGIGIVPDVRCQMSGCFCFRCKIPDPGIVPKAKSLVVSITGELNCVLRYQVFLCCVLCLL